MGILCGGQGSCRPPRTAFTHSRCVMTRHFFFDKAPMPSKIDRSTYFADSDSTVCAIPACREADVQRQSWLPYRTLLRVTDCTASCPPAHHDLSPMDTPVDSKWQRGGRSSQTVGRQLCRHSALVLSRSGEPPGASSSRPLLHSFPHSPLPFPVTPSSAPPSFTPWLLVVLSHTERKRETVQDDDKD